MKDNIPEEDLKKYESLKRTFGEDLKLHYHKPGSFPTPYCGSNKGDWQTTKHLSLVNCKGCLRKVKEESSKVNLFNQS